MVDDAFPLLEDGIIGRNLLQTEEAVMSYHLNPIVLARDVMNPISFLSHEQKAYHSNERALPNDYGYAHDPVAPIYSVKINTGRRSCHSEDLSIPQ